MGFSLLALSLLLAGAALWLARRWGRARAEREGWRQVAARLQQARRAVDALRHPARRRRLRDKFSRK